MKRSVPRTARKFSLNKMIGTPVRLLSTIVALFLLVSCERPDPNIKPPNPTQVATIAMTATDENPPADSARKLPPTPIIHRLKTPLPTYVGTPTPNPMPSLTAAGSANYTSHSVVFGETLSAIAQQYGATVDELLEINGLSDADFLNAGQTILVPGQPNSVGPSLKLIPDSELVYGPRAAGFKVEEETAAYGSYLLTYQEEVEGRLLSGSQIVQLVADRYSVNPRLLLALLEYRSGWLTHATTTNETYPMGYVNSGYEGLYLQLCWAANLVNLGFYGRSEGGLFGVELAGERIAFAADINDGTAGVQLMLAAHPDASRDSWLLDVGPSGFLATFSRLFGNPFAYTVDPLWPESLIQPSFSLPWAEGETWYYTGGPHGGWASGSAWAALDFAPGRQEYACQPSDAWVTAMVGGLVTRSDFGAVVVDMDGDGFPGTGWAVTYMHLDPRERVPVGATLNRGDRLGHPSCEGGFVNATHVHIARTFNGRWVSADGQYPFVLSGWTSKGLGREYDGLLIRGDTVIEACDCAEDWNAVTSE